MDPAQHHTLVIGAGPAGLAVGAALKHAGIPCIILEQGPTVATTWRRHYERLHLHTDKGHSGLPFMPFPASYPRYPARLQVIEYLEAYARRFELPVNFSQKVIAAGRAEEGWQVRTAAHSYRAANLVIAAGYCREPCRPQWPGLESFRGTVLHSCDYRSGEPFRGRRALVIGLGNSGGEIAIDLHEHGAQVGIAVRSPVNVIPRELFGIPILALGIAEARLPARLADALNSLILRVVVGDLSRYGLRRPAQGPITEIQRAGRVPLIDVGTVDLLKRGALAVYGGVERYEGDTVLFSDGRRAPFDAVILATGYRPRVSAFLEPTAGSCDEHGAPHASGGQACAPGLYFCGYRVSRTGMLREIAREALSIAAVLGRSNTSAEGREVA